MKKSNVSKEIRKLHGYIVMEYGSIVEFCRHTGADYSSICKFISHGTRLYTPQRKIIEATTPYRFDREVR